MSIVERARKAAASPQSLTEHLNNQSAHNRAISRFMSDTGAILAPGVFAARFQSDLDESEAIFLPSPGPLYGLLRKLGIDIETCKRVAYEERDHYAAARSLGLKTRISIEFTRKTASELLEGEISQTFVHVYLHYTLPPDANPDQARRMIETISLAPRHPSPDDLAKFAPTD